MKNIIALAVLVILGCGGESKTQTASSASESSFAINPTSKSCLVEITDPVQWYSKTELAGLVGEDEASINFKSNPDYDNCNFNWKNDRKYVMKVSSIEMEVPTNNVVGITIYDLDEKIEKAEKLHKKSFTYEQYFDTYHTTTKAGEEQVKEALEEKGKEDAKAKAAKGLLDMAPTEGHAEVGGLSDKANTYIQTAPGLRETRLAVLHGNAVVMINVDVSDEDEKDMEIARKVAEGVLGLCD